MLLKAQGLRFLLDEDLNPRVAAICRGHRLDVVSVHELDRLGCSDEDQLIFAAKEGRVLVTRNRDDYRELTRSFFEAGHTHRGVLIVPYSLPNNQPRLIARALLTWNEHRAGSGSRLDYTFDFLG